LNFGVFIFGSFNSSFSDEFLSALPFDQPQKTFRCIVVDGFPFVRPYSKRFLVKTELNTHKKILFRVSLDISLKCLLLLVRHR
jgi:hypothetical protein